MLPIEIIIRRASKDDAEDIAALYVQLVSDSAVSVLPERIVEISNDKNTALFVCEHNDRVLGTALVSLCVDVMYGFQPFAVVENVIIDSSARGQGIGTALLRHIETFCLASNCSKIMLLSSSQRELAHRFFERFGFVGSSKRGFVKYRRNFAVLS
jgi:GNAT superfamily N-acetyltransferase